VLFSSPEVVRDLVLGFIPDEWLHSLDYTTLEKVPGSYVTDDLRHRADDVIWRVRADGEWVYLYLLIEFQSRVDGADDDLCGPAVPRLDSAQGSAQGQEASPGAAHRAVQRGCEVDSSYRHCRFDTEGAGAGGEVPAQAVVPAH
jgi:hypothetical protein